MKAFLYAAALAAIPAASATAQPTDWRKTVSATAEGGMAMGNPKARVQLVEYGSMTCPHCRDFAAQGVPPLVANYVRSGKVRFEFRNYVLNGYDLAASLVARCAGPKKFFAATERLYAEQSKWIARVQAAPKERIAQAQALPAERQLAAIAGIAGLIPIGVASGIPVTQLNQCLADKGAAERLMAAARRASEAGIAGTPAFLINGRKVDAHGWAELEPLIKKAL